MKTLLLLGAGREQLLAINQAHELGLNVVACDQNPEAPGLAQADHAVVGDIRDPEAMYGVARQHDVSGVFTHAVEIPDVVALVAWRLGLPGLDPEIAARATNKVRRIRHLTEQGIPCARYAVADTESDLMSAAERIGFPLVIKPTDSAGARGVRVVASQPELPPAYRDAVAYSRRTQVILEEVMQGPEVSTESVVFEGVVRTFAFADRNYANSMSFYPYFIEDGINYPSALPEVTQRSVYELVERTIKSLGITWGAAKGDVIVDAGVPKIIEMAARTSGGWFGAGSISIATGTNMLKPLIQMAVGDQPELEALEPTRALGCAQRYVIPTEEGIVLSVTGVEEALAMPGVEMAEMFLPAVGQRIRRATNHAERLGQIICSGPTRDSAITRCEEAVSRIRLHLRHAGQQGRPCHL